MPEQKLEQLFPELDNDELVELAGHLIEQGTEAGFSAEVVAQAQDFMDRRELHHSKVKPEVVEVHGSGKSYICPSAYFSVPDLYGMGAAFQTWEEAETRAKSTIKPLDSGEFTRAFVDVRVVTRSTHSGWKDIVVHREEIFLV